MSSWLCGGSDWTVNTLRLRQDGCHFPDDILKWIFLNENLWISIKISLQFLPRGPINNIPALVQIMVWPRPGDKPLFAPMMVSVLMHICVTQPQWVNQFIYLYDKKFSTKYSQDSPHRLPIKWMVGAVRCLVVVTISINLWTHNHRVIFGWISILMG